MTRRELLNELIRAEDEARAIRNAPHRINASYADIERLAAVVVKGLQAVRELIQ